MDITGKDLEAVPARSEALDKEVEKAKELEKATELLMAMDREVVRKVLGVRGDAAILFNAIVLRTMKNQGLVAFLEIKNVIAESTAYGSVHVNLYTLLAHSNLGDWCFTAYQIDELMTQALRDWRQNEPNVVRYLVVGLEQCPRTGRPHYQGLLFDLKVTVCYIHSVCLPRLSRTGYVELLAQARLSWLKRHPLPNNWCFECVNLWLIE